MDLVTRGRLSVQRVEAKAWDAICLLAQNGGWDDIDLKPRKNSTKAKSIPKTTESSRVSKRGKTATHTEEFPSTSIHNVGEEPIKKTTTETASTASHKRRVPPVENDSAHNDPPRRSCRRKISESS